MPKRVRHHTNDSALEAIRHSGGIKPSRGWFGADFGVHVEVEPFASARPSRPGGHGPKNDLGCVEEGAFVEFDAPDSLIEYVCGPRNAGVIPVPLEQILSLEALNPEFVKVRQRFWQFWRRSFP